MAGLHLCMTASARSKGGACSRVTGVAPGSRSALLSGTRTTRLYRALVQPGRAVSASCVAAYPGEKHPGARPTSPPLPLSYTSFARGDGWPPAGNSVAPS